MAGLWQRMLNTLFTTQKAKQRLRAVNRRSLRLEGLERRQTMDATISGIVFNDLDASDAQNGAEVGIGGVAVELYNDLGTVGQFDAGTDTLVTTTNSSSTVGSVGRYSFNITTAGDYLVRQQGTVTGFAQRSAQRTQAVNISPSELTTVTSVQTIDSFDVGAQNISVLTTNPISDTASDASILGTERDLYAERNSGAGDFQIAIDQTNNNLLRISTDGATTGEARIIYDGSTDANPAIATDGAFSPAVDLTSGNAAQGMRLSMRVDANGASIRVNVRSASGLSTSGVIAIPNAGTPQEVLFPFGSGTNSITGTADLTQVTSIELIVITNADADVDIDQVGTYGQTVETIDLANIPEMTIGNFVFRDLNNNGLLDGSDAGIGGVTVQLYNDTNGNDTLDPAELSAQPTPTSTITSSTVGSVGQYSFPGLLPGDYIVVVPNSQFATSSPLDNMTASIVPVSPPANNANTGVLFSTFGVASAVSLVAGAAPVNDGDTDANTNLSRDFGFTPPTITIVKDDNPNTARVGDPLTYTLTVTNTSPQASGRDSTNTTITDTLPQGLTIVGTPSFTITNPNGTGGNATFDSGTRLISANVGTLAPGQIATLTIIATVGSTFSNPTLNTGNVTNSEGSTGNSQISTPLAPNVDLGITKTIVGGATSVGVGGTLTYRVTITNNTNLAVTGVTVNDDLPTGFTPGTLPSGVATGTAPADLVWSVGNLAANGTATVDIPVNVATSATPGPTFTNTVTIVTANQTFTDSDPTNNSASVNIAVTPRYDLRVTKTNNLTTLATGQTFTYTMTAINDGPSSASNVTISDTLPASLAFVSSTVGSAVGQLFTANLGTLAANATSSPVNVVVRVLTSATGANISNTASVTADNALTQESNTNNNTANDQDPLTRTVTLGITKLDSIDPVTAGGAAFTYTVSAFNSGNADTSNVVITDPLPIGIELVDPNNPGTFNVNDPTPRNGNLIFNSTTRTITANVGTLLAGGSATVNRAQFTLNVRAIGTAAAGQVTNTASVTDGGTPVTAPQTTTIQRVLDLAVDKTTTATNAVAGQNLTYTIVVSHATGSLSTAEDILVTDTLPSTLTSPIVTTSAGTIQAFSNNNGVITGRLTSLAPGQTATVTVTATVVNGTPDGTQIINPVTISTAGDTATSGNNADNVSLNVQSLVQVSGTSYNDVNGNGIFDTGDLGIQGVTITLQGTGSLSSVTQTTTTGTNGTYSFTGLQRGIYTITETQPANFTGTGANPGVSGTTTVGTEGINAITNADLSIGSAVAMNFPNIADLSKRSELASVRGRAVTDFTTVRRRR